MSERIADDRGHAAVLGRRYFDERSISLDLLVETFQETTDPLIAELLDLAANQPPRSGLLGAHADQYAKRYRPHVTALLQELERGDQGRLPERDRWSKKKLAGQAALALLAFSAVADRLAIIARHFSGKQPLTPWKMLFSVAGLVFMSLLTVAVVFSVFNAIRLYRAERRRRTG